jgi:selT/selW/selH-like putative selenoprotein
VSLAAELNAEGLEATARPGTTGQFDVTADGKLVFSKHDVGRFPDDGEVLGLLEAG